MNNFTLSIQGTFIILYVLVGAAALGISWWSYRNLVPQLSRLKRGLLIALRSLGIFLLVLLLLEPLATRFSQKTIGNKLGVVFDLSSSMQLEDGGGKRCETALETFMIQRPENINIRYFGFSDSTFLLDEIPDCGIFTGKVTNLASAMVQPVKAAENEIGALLLVTDGSGNVGSDPLAVAMSSPVPVYSLVVGDNIDYRDIAITGVNYPPVSYINTELPIIIEVRSSGYEGRSAILEIRDGRQTVASKNLTLPAAGAFTTVDFPVTFSDPGAKNLTAAISSFDDEIYNENNVRNFAIKLLKDKTKILLLSSSLSWEYTFLKRALMADPHFEVQPAIAGANDIIAGRDLPASGESWRDIDLIIALDIAARSIGTKFNDLKTAVESGAGFLFIAGDQTRVMPGGGWDELLPITIHSRASVIKGEFFAIPGKQAMVSSVTDIEGMEWNELSPLEYIYKGIELKDRAFVFLSTSASTESNLPILVGGFHKLGKAAAVLGYPWWTKSFRSDIGGQSSDAMNRFWGNLLRWLVAREDMDKFNLTSSKAVYRLGEQVEFSATLFDESYNLQSGAQIIIQIADSTGLSREFRLASVQAGRYSGEYGSPPSGHYGFSGYAIVGDDTVGTSAGEFIVETFGLEQENPSANYSLMRQIASLTGAESYTSDNFQDFSSQMRLKIDKIDVSREYSLTGNTYILIFILAMFALEWGIRKFSQLA